MSLETGARLGPYGITGKLGVGGMGEVYRAHDSRLNREVAVKVLKAEVSNDPARRARFEQEARAAAALNHPNIVSIYDVGTQDGALYIVTELVPGDTLDAILTQGTMPLKRLLDIATQVSDGMAAAHAFPLTHRDLKPANIIVTPDGRAKILDFGLAKMGRGDGRGEDATLTAALTQDGQVLGTVNYMSPEQATGKDVDTRSDQFAFGAILHEMVTGKKPFARDSMVQTMSAIVTDDAPPIEREIPAPLRWIIARCLSKAPVDRYQSSRDLFLELRSLKEHLGDLSTVQMAAVEVAPAAPPPAGSWKKIATGVVAGIMLTAAAAFFLPQRKTLQTRSLAYTPFSFEAGGNSSPVWAPDGKGVAFAARQNQTDPDQVYVRYLDSSTANQLTHIPEGAAPVVWTPNGRIIFWSNKSPMGLWSISTVGGEAEPFQAIGKDRSVASGVSADGSAIAIFGELKEGQYGVNVVSPPGTPPKPYVPSPFTSKDVFNVPQIRFSPDGKQILLYRNSGAGGEEAWLLPYPADTSHPPHRVLEKLPLSAGTPQFSWMPDSRRIVVAMSTGADPSKLYLADTVSGEYSVLSSGTTSQGSPAVSPDGHKLIAVEGMVDFDIVSIDRTNAEVTPLLATKRNENMPAWAGNGSGMAYVTDRNGAPEIWLHAPGQNERPLVTYRDFPPNTTQWFMAPRLSPDGSRVVYGRIEKSGSSQLWISAPSGGAPVPLLKGGEGAFAGTWSPDGTWFTYLQIAGGKLILSKVKVTGQAVPEVLQASAQPYGNPVPVWSPAGDWILHNDVGFKLISPDGKAERDLNMKEDATCGFSRDGASVYCIRLDRPGATATFVTIPVTGGSWRTIGTVAAANIPRSNLSPAMLLTLTPDGKSFTYATAKGSANLWMIEGIE